MQFIIPTDYIMSEKEEDFVYFIELRLPTQSAYLMFACFESN